MAFTVANRVGRLIEVRVVPPLTIEEATRFVQQIVELIGTQPGKIVACTDLRSAARTTDPATIDMLAGIIRSENPRLERNALILSSSSATFVLQMERMIKSAGAVMRRIFKGRADAESWLGEVLNSAERRRLS